jgi:hypothetical protein
MFTLRLATILLILRRFAEVASELDTVTAEFLASPTQPFATRGAILDICYAILPLLDSSRGSKVDELAKEYFMRTTEAVRRQIVSWRDISVTSMSAGGNTYMSSCARFGLNTSAPDTLALCLECSVTSVKSEALSYLRRSGTTLSPALAATISFFSLSNESTTLKIDALDLLSSDSVDALPIPFDTVLRQYRGTAIMPLREALLPVLGAAATSVESSLSVAFFSRPAT